MLVRWARRISRTLQFKAPTMEKDQGHTRATGTVIATHWAMSLPSSNKQYLTRECHKVGKEPRPWQGCGKCWSLTERRATESRASPWPSGQWGPVAWPDSVGRNSMQRTLELWKETCWWRETDSCHVLSESFLPDRGSEEAQATGHGSVWEPWWPLLYR